MNNIENKAPGEVIEFEEIILADRKLELIITKIDGQFWVWFGNGKSEPQLQQLVKNLDTARKWRIMISQLLRDVKSFLEL